METIQSSVNPNIPISISNDADIGPLDGMTDQSESSIW